MHFNCLGWLQTAFMPACTYRYYEGGHMMYADIVCLQQMTHDIEKFYGKLVGESRGNQSQDAVFWHYCAANRLTR